MAARKNPPEKIKTGKEMKKKVLALVKAGKSNAEILASLGIGRTTLGTLKEELRGEGKLPTYDRVAAAKAAWARRKGEKTEEETEKAADVGAEIEPDATPVEAPRGKEEKTPAFYGYRAYAVKAAHEVIGSLEAIRLLSAVFGDRKRVAKYGDAEKMMNDVIRLLIEGAEA